MTDQSFLPIKKLKTEPYSKTLSYPRVTKRQIKARISEIEGMGITRVSFQGRTRLGTVDVLGKGYVGIVILAKQRKNKIVALKIRRLDSSRTEMKTEAKLLKYANEFGVGPKLLKSSKNFLVMEYLPGEKIRDWIKGLGGKGSTKLLKKTINKILEDCYTLDLAGLDHGELSSIGKHVIIKDSNATIIDFESSSLVRKVSNVTSATQGIYIGSGISKKVQKIYKIPPKEKIIGALRNYKREHSRTRFDDLLKILKLRNVF